MMADTATAPAADSGLKRPDKPDEAKFKADLAEREKAHSAAQAEFNAIRQKLDGSRPSKSTPQNDRWKELVDEQKEIRTKQSANKSSRQGQQDKYDINDREIKNLIAQQKDARSRVGFKNADEIEKKIQSIMKQVDSGQMKLVDEKKALAEVSNLRRQIKGFTGLDDLQKKIDDKKADNAELKKTFDNAESKALSDKYEQNQKELDKIKADRDDVNKNFDKLKGDREALYEKQQGTWKAIQELKDNYYKQRKEYKEFEDKIYQQRREKQRLERDQYEKDKRKKAAEARLEEASAPAFTDEILTAEGIIRHFDPSYGAAEGDKGPGKYAASASRSIDESGFKGMNVLKKEEEDFFVGGAGKKKGKGKKGTAASTESKNFNLSIDIIEGLGKLGIDPPTNQNDIPGTIEKLKEKVAAWKRDQKSQTDKNIEKAKKDIEKLEQEASEAAKAVPPARTDRRRQDKSKKVSQKDAGIDDSGREVNVSAEQEQQQEKDGVADAAKDLKAVALEDVQNDKVDMTTA